MNLKNTTRIAGIFALLLVAVFFFRANEPRYDFKETVVKVAGKFGHGSGNIVESGKDYSILLTNKHVCEGVNATPIVSQALAFINAVSKLHPKCSTFACLSKSEPRFGPVWFMVLFQLEVNNISIKVTESIAEFVEKLNQIKKQQVQRPLFIKFNNLPLKIVKGKIFATSELKDLCLVRIPVGNLPIIKISYKTPIVGDRVQTIGNPYGVENHMVEGFAGNISEIYRNMYQMITAPIYPGQSGSGTFNSDGELVGVNTLSDLRVPTIGYMIILNDVKLFLKKHLKLRKISFNI